MKNIDIGQMTEKLQKEWEKTLFWLSLLVLLLALAFLLINLFRTKEENLSMSTTVPKPRTLLNEKALSFLDDPPVLAKDTNPFAFQKIFAVKQPKKQPPENKNAKPPPETKKITEPPPAAVPIPPPAKVLKMRYLEFKTIEYKGSTKSASGETLALISVFDSRTKETKDLTVAQGDMIDDLAVGVVTSDMIVILDKKNQEQSIMLQTSEKVVEE